MQPTWLIVVLALIKAVFIAVVFALTLAAVLVWAERRQSAMIQDRLGPNRANIGRFRAWGILHFLADAVKMMFKEDVVPARAHRPLFALAPILALTPVLVAISLIPWGPP